jgi:hypothetical protein
MKNMLYPIVNELELQICIFVTNFVKLYFHHIDNTARKANFRTMSLVSLISNIRSTRF